MGCDRVIKVLGYEMSTHKFLDASDLFKNFREVCQTETIYPFENEESPTAQHSIISREQRELYYKVNHHCQRRKSAISYI